MIRICIKHSFNNGSLRSKMTKPLGYFEMKAKKKNFMNPHSGESVEMSKTHPNVDGM